MLILTVISDSFAESKMSNTINQTEAIEIANHEFSRNGNKLDQFSVSIDPQPSQERYWMIWYNKNSPFPVPGGKHTVRVDMKTGQATFLKGE
jgi:hypothetical protein